MLHRSGSWFPGRFKDYISTPKTNGYRSLHTTLILTSRSAWKCRSAPARCTERRIRPRRALGLQAGRASADGQVRWLRDLIEIVDASHDAEELLEHTAGDLPGPHLRLHPQGRAVPAAAGATPVDFAFAVHTDLGAHASAPRSTAGTCRCAPSCTTATWSRSSRASSRTPRRLGALRRHRQGARPIRRHIRHQPARRLHRAGRELLQRQAKADHLQVSEKLLEKALETLPQRTVEDLLTALGEGTIGPKLVLDAAFPERKSRMQTKARPLASKILPLRRPPTAAAAMQRMPILGLPDGVAFTYAGCCHPVPGDPIVGVVRSGRSVAIHKNDCATVARDPAAQERVLDIGWNDQGAPPRAAARIVVMGMNEPGVLGTISTIIGRQDGNIADVKFGRRQPELYEMFLDVEVDGLDQLHRIMAALRAAGGVCSVERAEG